MTWISWFASSSDNAVDEGDFRARASARGRGPCVGNSCLAIDGSGRVTGFFSGDLQIVSGVAQDNSGISKEVGHAKSLPVKLNEARETVCNVEDLDAGLPRCNNSKLGGGRRRHAEGFKHYLAKAGLLQVMHEAVGLESASEKAGARQILMHPPAGCPRTTNGLDPAVCQGRRKFPGHRENPVPFDRRGVDPESCEGIVHATSDRCPGIRRIELIS